MTQQSAVTSDAPKRLPASCLLAGYLLAVTVSGVCFAGFALSRVIWQRLSTGIFFPIGDTFRVLFSDLLTFPVFWLIAFALSVLPCSLILAVARHFNLRSVFYYVIAGMAVGMCGDLILTFALHGFHWYTDSPYDFKPSRLQEVADSACIFSVVGAVGGIAFWAYAIERPRKAHKSERNQ